MEFLEKRVFRQNTITVIFALWRICNHCLQDILDVNIVAQKTVTNENPVLERRKDI